MKPTLSDDRLTALVSAHAANPGIARGILQEHLDRGGRVPDQLLSFISPVFGDIFGAMGL